VQEVGSQLDFRSTFAQMDSRLLRGMRRKHRIRDRVERALGAVKAFSVLAPGGVQLILDVDAVPGVADSGDPEQDLVDLLR
jgi:predicted methyltransferase